MKLWHWLAGIACLWGLVAVLTFGQTLSVVGAQRTVAAKSGDGELGLAGPERLAPVRRQ